MDRDTSTPGAPLIAYYCRQFAMEKGMKLRETDPSPDEGTAFLMELMTSLEGRKADMEQFSKEESKSIVSAFAMGIFDRAEQADRGAENGTDAQWKGVAQRFYAAGTFLEVLQQFGDLDPEIEQRRKFAKWKATEILKALKEGRAPVPGGPNDEPPAGFDMPAAPTESAPAVMPFVPPPAVAPMGGFDMPAAPAASAPAVMPFVPPPAVAPPLAPPPAPAPAPVIPIVPTPAFVPTVAVQAHMSSGDQERSKDAIEHLRFAIRSLETREPKQKAMDHIENALRNLR